MLKPLMKLNKNLDEEEEGSEFSENEEGMITEHDMHIYPHQSLLPRPSLLLPSPASLISPPSSLLPQPSRPPSFLPRASSIILLPPSHTPPLMSPNNANDMQKTFNLIPDTFCPEVFDCFSNNYSRKREIGGKKKNSKIFNSFELQFKFESKALRLSRKETLKIDNEPKFTIEESFKPEIFVNFRNGWSKDWKLTKKKSLDDWNISSIRKK